MPKEIISDTVTPFRLEVRWAHRDMAGDVQIASLNADSPFYWNPEDDSIPARSEADEREHLQFDGWWLTLGRQELNALIRVLRRARNQAFGADE